MQAIQYHLLAQVEEQHWWHRTLRRAVAEMLAKFGDGRRLAMLDAGCGTGGLLAALRDRHSVYGLDFSSLALSYSKTRGLDRLAGGRVDRMPFADASFDAVVSVDVLSHRSIPSDRVAVCEIQRVLRPGGLFVLQLSAFERLRGAHDESVHQARRYTRRQVTDLLEGAGFEVLLARYRLAFMPPLMVLNNLLARLRARTGATREPDIALPSTLPNNILGAAARLDWWLGTLIPWGSSVFCVARRLSSSETGLR